MFSCSHVRRNKREGSLRNVLGSGTLHLQISRGDHLIWEEDEYFSVQRL